ncbi:tetratricopeptide repeat protein [uncultured Azohydromonas sp.]|jgi:Predicted O-linked N-acetylglucosamine transferase, SPINDLY family|uniref:O-linked N-acetylglucosamine transferase, SPINDLY family protein n=1 Tax=uncultured Azohydromonas sp. TaxID=487342 RepID=UPI002617E8F5|nr:tetratricopeptide repeat protein [uncultured Azohydromonas sp.]
MPSQTVSPPAAREAALEQLLAQARSGRMPLPELFDSAGRLTQQGLSEASARLYEDWLAHTASPLRHLACFNWGVVLGTLGRAADAKQAYRRALETAPDFAQARLNLGHQLEQLGRHDEALAQWRSIALQPAADDAALQLRLHALNNSARLCEQLRRFDEAEAWLRLSLELDPAQPGPIQHYVHLRQKQCAWPVYQPVGALTHYHLLAGTSALAMLSATDDPALHMLAAQRFVLERGYKSPPTPLHAKQPPRTGKLRIGYLSGDLHMHAVGLLTAELYETHDRERFEVHAFCWSREDGSPLRARLRAGFDKVWPIGSLSDEAAAQLIAQQGIDVLVDLQGLTSGARPAILTQRPAPVQVSYLGFPGTCGIPGVDWVIADRYVMPPELLPYSSERPIYLPGCYQVSDRQREIGAKPTRAQYGLPEDAFVFCAFNNNFKFTEEVFRLWMRVLHAVPGSVLWLLADNEWAQENMRRAADAQGVARERLVFAPRVAPPDYLARLPLADLFLDTFPYNGGTTASDVLWMGLPLLTCSGRSYISRMAGSLLTHLGLPELATGSLAEYERMAVLLGNTPARVASYRRYLTEQGRQSALFDTPRFVRGLEAEFERLALEHRKSR